MWLKIRMETELKITLIQMMTMTDLQIFRKHRQVRTQKVMRVSQILILDWLAGGDLMKQVEPPLRTHPVIHTMPPFSMRVADQQVGLPES